jgi:3-deoxy-D-manno-octulosonate 8-phosphate phosphatase (KDO 8-P phosphatase)
MKAFDVRDGHGMKMLQRSGVKLAIITSRTSRCVAARAANLGIDLLFQGVADKLVTFERLLAGEHLEAAAAAYMGDDLVDLPVLSRCGLAASVPGAPKAVLQAAQYVTCAEGGRGAAREFCELLMRAQGTFDSQVAVYQR